MVTLSRLQVRRLGLQVCRVFQSRDCGKELINDRISMSIRDLFYLGQTFAVYFSSPAYKRSPVLKQKNGYVWVSVLLS